MNSPALFFFFFFFKIVLVIPDPLNFHIIFRISLSVSASAWLETKL